MSQHISGPCLMTLRITPARKELLQAIADGSVSDQYTIRRGWYSEWDRGAEWARHWRSRQHRVVNASVDLLRGKGLIRLTTRTGYSHDPRPWELTDAGRAALDGAA